MDIETDKSTTREEVLKEILKALKRNRQDWEIKGMIATDFRDLVIPDLARGDRANDRAEDIAKVKRMEISEQVATWLGQHKSREHYKGKPTGLQLTIVSKTIPSEGADRKYIVRGKEVERELKLFEWKRAPGTDRWWFTQGNARRYSELSLSIRDPRYKRPLNIRSIPLVPQEFIWRNKSRYKKPVVISILRSVLRGFLITRVHCITPPQAPR